MSNKPLAPKGVDPKELARLSLLEEIAVEAEMAPKGHVSLYRWLRETAEAARPFPTWGHRPYMRGIGEELAMRAVEVSAQFGAIISRWHPRFQQAFAPDGIKKPEVSDLEDLVRDLSDSPTRDELLSVLRRAKDAAPKQQKFAYDWLIARAEKELAIPVHSHRPNIAVIAKLMKVGYAKALHLTWLLAFWAPLFPAERVPATVMRTELPDTAHAGTDVPSAMLVARMRQARKAETDADAAKLLDHLIKVADGDRTIPQFNRRPAFKTIMRAAGVGDSYRKKELWQVCSDWLGFFHLDSGLTVVRSNGKTQQRRNAAIEVTRHIDGLRKAGMRRLERDRTHPNSHSTAALADYLNLTRSSVGMPSVRAIIETYIEECRVHYGEGDGLGDVYSDNKTQERKDAEKQFRGELLAYARQETEAGRPLPGSLTFPNSLDYDEFVRRSGKSGPDLRENEQFRNKLRKLKPTYTRFDLVGVPKTYGQLIALVQKERLKGVSKSSEAVTKSKIKRAIEHFCEWQRKSVSDLIEEDFEEPGFSEALDAIVEAGGVGQPKHWRGELEGAKSKLEESQAAQLDGDFGVIVLNAVIADGRSWREIAELVGLKDTELRNWGSGNTLPTRDETDQVSALESVFGMEPGSLSKHIDHTRSDRRAPASVEIPDGVREFLPDDYRKLAPGALKSMIAWIEENLVRSGTDYGRRMAEFQKGVHQKKTATRSNPEAEVQTDAVDDTDPEVEATPDPAISRALDKIIRHETRGLNKAVVQELRDLLVHMTEVMPMFLDRRPNSFWRAESTAPMKLRMLARFLRWQTLPEEEGGLGRKAAALTLGDLIHPPIVFAYIDHKARRLDTSERDGKNKKRFTGSEVDFLITVRALVSKTYGFVEQSTEMAERIRIDSRHLSNGAFVGMDGHVYNDEENKRADKGEEPKSRRQRGHEVMPGSLCGLDPDDFRSACHAAERKYATAQVQVERMAQSGRDPAEAIEGLLDAKRPMEALLKQFAIASQRIPPIANGKQPHHLYVRDLLLCRLLALTTLRSKNLRDITISGDEPQLRFEEAKSNGEKKGAKGRWLLEIPWEEFKNAENAVLFGRRRNRQNYRKYLPDTNGLHALLKYYVEVSRPALMKNVSIADTHELFVNSAGSPLDTEQKLWKAVRGATARWVAWNPFRNEGVENVLPFGPHVFRDLRATDIIKNARTNNPFLEAALALQTSPGMIQAHYGVVKTEHRTADDDITFLEREGHAWTGLDSDVFSRLLEAA